MGRIPEPGLPTCADPAGPDLWHPGGPPSQSRLGRISRPESFASSSGWCRSMLLYRVSSGLMIAPLPESTRPDSPLDWIVASSFPRRIDPGHREPARPAAPLLADVQDLAGSLRSLGKPSSSTASGTHASMGGRCVHSRDRSTSSLPDQSCSRINSAESLRTGSVHPAGSFQQEDSSYRHI